MGCVDSATHEPTAPSGQRPVPHAREPLPETEAEWRALKVRYPTAESMKALGDQSGISASSLERRRVKSATHELPCVEHGLPTAAAGRFVASADRPPPWTTLRRRTSTTLMDREVAL